MGRLRFAKPRNSLPRQGQTFHEMESFKVFCPTFCILQKVGKRPPQGGGRLPQASQKGGMAAGKEAAERRKKHTKCAVPNGANFPKGKFQKGFNFVSAKLMFECADSRFGKSRSSLLKRF